MQVSFSVEQFDRRRWQWQDGTTAEIGSAHTGTSKFDLTMLLFDADADGMWGEVEFATDLYDASTVRRFVDRWLAVLAEVTADPQARLSQLTGMPAAELELVRTWSTGSEGDLPWRSVDEGVVARALECPEAVAVRDRGSSLTYGELLARADGLAAVLRDAGVARGAVVGLCAERSADLVVGMLGVLRAGAVYLALDPAYPRERLAFMLEDSAARVVVGHEELFDRLPLDGHVTVDVRRTEPVRVLSETVGSGVGGVSPVSPACLLYTSGSTGRPKGALVPHAAVMRLVCDADYVSLSASSVVAQLNSASFDPLVFEVWGALLNGGRMVIVPPDVVTAPEALRALVRSEEVTTLFMVTALFQATVSLVPDAFASVDQMYVGGEALHPEVVRRAMAWGETRFHNVYGPTEVTTYSTCQPLRAESMTASCIGSPIRNTQAWVVDRFGGLAPVGVPGELFLGGPGVALGYLRRPALTAEKFVPDAFSGTAGGRLYRTGDLARWLPDGTLEFLGRADDQVKVRGFRIEPGEIETVLLTHPRVDAAVVTARRGTDHALRLACYAQGENLGPADATELRAYLAERLPEYMVPAHVTILDTLPHLPNGKIDRKKLPEPDMRTGAGEYVAPSGETERVLVEAWAEVLGVDRVGVRDNFFDLGGDSIRSVQVLAAVRRRGLTFELSDLFQHTTVERLAVLCLPYEAPAQELEPFSMVTAEDRARIPEGVVDAYPMTALQTGMVYEMEADVDVAPYLNAQSYRVRARFDEVLFRRAVGDVVARHEVLRTSFGMRGFDELLQLVHATAEVPVVVEDVRERSEDEREERIAACVRRERGIPFDLSAPGLLRFFVHVLEDGEFQWTLVEHHAILDGWSLNSTLGEIIGRYAVLLRDPEAPRDPAPVSRFREYVALERAGAADSESRAFWEQVVGGWERPSLPRLPLAERGGVRLPVDGTDVVEHVASEQASPEGEVGYGSFETRLDAGLCEELEALARRLGLPLKSVLLGVHLVVLSKLTGHPRPVTGASANGRLGDDGGTDVRGLFLNSVPFSVLVEGTLEDIVRSVFAREAEILPHWRFPHVEIQALAGGDPLFETHFVYNHFHVLGDALENADDVEIVDMPDGSRMQTREEPTNFPLTSGFVRDPRSGEMVLMLSYHRRDFAGDQVRVYRDYYLRVLSALAANPQCRVEEVDVRSEAERRALASWNDTHADLPWRSVDEGVVARALECPEAVAVRDRGSSLTYGELLARADGVAAVLRDAGVGCGAVVGLCAERSADLVVGMLGVLRAGAAYVALDPAYPRERLAFMLEDSGARVVVGHEELFDRLPLDGHVTIDVRMTPPASGLAPEAANRGQDVACLVYTSGSTGMPKGALLTHAAAVRLVCGSDLAELSASSVVAQLNAASFDPLVLEVWGALLNGGRLVIVPPETVTSPEELRALVREERVTAMAIVSSLFNATIPVVPDVFATLDQVFVGGEAINPAMVERALEAGGARFTNIYGPTEVTTVSTCEPLVAGSVSAGRIGRPIRNTQAWVVDRSGHPVPVGVPGELWLGGSGVARGYTRRPALTAEKFVPDAFSGTVGGRLYRTGDLVRWLPDGSLEFLGRIDHQVKVRGFRVEPGEVEEVLLSHPGVESAVVVASRGPNGVLRLAGYAQGEGLGAPDGAELRVFLAERLPEYMVPLHVMVLDALPQLPNGKIDLQGLPEPDLSADMDAYVPPADETEEVIARIWSEVLGVERVSATDDFFDLGGHSLHAIRVTARINTRLGTDIDMNDLFETDSLRALADRCRTLPVATSDESRAFWEQVVGEWERPLLPRLPLSERDGVRLPVDGTDVVEHVASEQASPEGEVGYGSFETRLDVGLCEELEALARRLGLPLKSVLLGAHLIVLSKLTGHPRPGTGMLTDERGPDLNSVPFSVPVEGTLEDIVRSVFAREAEVLPHRRFPHTDIQELAGGTLYETQFLHDQPYGPGETPEVVKSPFVCGFVSDPRSGEMVLMLAYHRREFAGDQVRVYRDYYLRVLSALARSPQCRVDEVDVRSEAERRALASWNDTHADLPWRSVDEGVVARALECPEAVAVRDRGSSLTYGELLARADGVAAALRDAGVGRGAVVGLCAERSADLVVGMLGVLRVGAAYVALDPAYPRERLAFMLEDSGARVVVGQEELFDRLPLDGHVTVDVRRTEPVRVLSETVGSGVGGVSPVGPACLLYTSGSTGRPKGALVPHAAVMRLVCDADYVSLSASSVVAQLNSASFDPLVFEVWGALLNGGRMVIVPPDVVTAPEALRALVRSEGVTTLFMVTALFQATVSLVPDAFASVDQVYVGGEAIIPEVVRRAMEWGDTRFHNVYGPTEVTTYSTCEPLRAESMTAARIGPPIRNTQAWVVDRFGGLAPVGVPGELFLGGPGVALGYLRRPALTAEKFVPDALSGTAGARLYHTGDLARWLPDGTLEFLGRADDQVKVRGFRIEPGEIEAVLLTHPRVDAAAVTARRGTDNVLRLAGYAQGETLGPADTTELRAYLAERLPEYMVPAHVTILDTLPHLPNGKIDRKSLPQPEPSGQAVPVRAVRRRNRGDRRPGLEQARGI
ncbi:amino acid adenylation domain-containing protein [Streptomyces sp. NPDC052052]|uniref:non-ribosomal peptide synthetase n=1 Tax=Streptomyces sp. NPDC052052 TaxID=3154756 RepID=UPI0034168546